MIVGSGDENVSLWSWFPGFLSSGKSTRMHRSALGLGVQYGQRWVWIRLQGCSLTAPGRLRRPTFGLGRLKERDWSPGRAPSSLAFLSWCCSKAGDRFLSFKFGRLRVLLGEKYSCAKHALKLFFKLVCWSFVPGLCEHRMAADGGWKNANDKMQMEKCG